MHFYDANLYSSHVSNCLTRSSPEYSLNMQCCPKTFSRIQDLNKHQELEDKSFFSAPVSALRGSGQCRVQK